MVMVVMAMVVALVTAATAITVVMASTASTAEGARRPALTVVVVMMEEAMTSGAAMVGVVVSEGLTLPAYEHDLFAYFEDRRFPWLLLKPFIAVYPAGYPGTISFSSLWVFMFRFDSIIGRVLGYC